MIILVDLAGLFSGAFLAIGVILWLILAFFGGTIADQAVPVFNLVISFLFLGGAIFEIVKVYKEEKKKVIAIIEILALLAFAIYGYFVPYNNSVFHFSYRPLASAIHTTWLPVETDFWKTFFFI